MSSIQRRCGVFVALLCAAAAASAKPAAAEPSVTPRDDDYAGWLKKFSLRDVVLGTPLSAFPKLTPHQAAIDKAHVSAGSSSDPRVAGYEMVLNAKECANRTDCDINGGGEMNMALGEWRGGVEFLRVFPTLTESKRIYRVEFRFHNDDVVEKTSKLGTALIAKYGEPYTWDQRIEWHAPQYHPPDGGLMVTLSCDNHDKWCLLVAEDAVLRWTEEKKQEQLDSDRKKAKAAPPPKF
jgi:hypothetical protein